MRLSIRSKLLGIFALFIVAMAVLGWQGIAGMQNIKEEIDIVYSTQFVYAQTVANANNAFLNWDRAAQSFLLADTFEKKKQLLQVMLEQNSAAVEHLRTLAEAPKIFSAREKELIIRLRDEFQRALPLYNGLLELSRAGKMEEANEVIRAGFWPIIDSIDEDISEFQRLQETKFLDAQEDARNHYQQASQRISLVIGMVSLVLLFVSMLLARTIVRSLNQLVSGTREFGRGNLAHRVAVASKDEISQVATALNDMAAQRKRAEDALLESQRQLRLLSSQLLMVQETERKRIAGELHDNLGQILSAIKFGIETALENREQGADAGKSLEILVPIIQSAIEDVRRMYTHLRPTLLDDLGIVATIGWFCREFQREHAGITIEKEIEIAEADIEDVLKIVIFRIVQEAFNNIAMHSQAELVSLSLAKSNGAIELTIEDNGVGFDSAAALAGVSPSGGFGLTSMKERVDLSGGTMTITSVQGEGTTLRISWPARMAKTPLH